MTEQDPTPDIPESVEVMAARILGDVRPAEGEPEPTEEGYGDALPDAAMPPPLSVEPAIILSGAEIDALKQVLKRDDLDAFERNVLTGLVRKATR